jgi:hypothetical protein
MSAVQKKILGIVVAKITERGFEAPTKPHWSNIGDIHISLAGKFGTLARVRYDFQDSTFILTIYKTVNGKPVGVPSQPPRQGYFDHYLKYEDERGFSRFLQHLGETLDQIEQPSKAEGKGNLFLVRTLEADDDGDPYYTGVVRAKDMEAAVRFTREEMVQIMEEQGEKLQIRVYPLNDVEEGVLPTADPGFQDFPKRKGKGK